ncbi:MAG: hypothetical protein JRF33_17760 [Deltaproteobacteria bacterium]|nr:hypothetical protein [Deltaproteobacteria bacterium]
MNSMPKILITGAPESGKTDLIQAIVETVVGIEAAGVKPAGILSLLRKDKKGKPELVLKAMDGREVIFATYGKGRGNRVGKFQVEPDAFEELALDALSFKADKNLYVIDEIGPMQTMSRIFSETAKMLLKKSGVAVIASVSKQGRGFIREVKRMPGLDTHEVTEANFDELLETLSKKLLTAFADRVSEEDENAEKLIIE